MDRFALQIYTILIVIVTVGLTFAAGYFRGRRSRASKGPVAGFGRLREWVRGSIEDGRPLHLSFGSAGVERENAAVAAAEAELFYHIIQSSGSGDAGPIISASSAATLPLCQDTVRRAWAGDDRRGRAQWYPQGPRSLAFAAGVTAIAQAEDPAAHILAGSFGPELALILDDAARRGQGSLAVSDQLEGQAIAFAMADEVLIGEQLFSAAARLSHDTTAAADAWAQDVWRGLLVVIMSGLFIVAVGREMGLGGWPVIAGAAVGLAVVAGLLLRRPRSGAESE